MKSIVAVFVLMLLAPSAAVGQTAAPAASHASELSSALEATTQRVGPAVVETYHDHRMAMGFTLTGLRAPGVVIANPSCVTKTFPAFFAVLDDLVHGRNRQP